MRDRFLAGCFSLLVLSCQANPPQEAEISDLRSFSGPYFSQEPPRDTARIFMPGIVTTHGRDGNITFLDEGRLCVFTSDESGTRLTRLVDGRWTEPHPVPWAPPRGLRDYTLGGDGRTFFWQSSRPTAEGDTIPDQNLWRSEWTGVGWTEPSPLPAIVNDPEFNERYPTVTAAGSVYFFTHDRPDALYADLYVNRVENGEYLATERLPWPINTDNAELDFIVAPDDGYLIFSSDRPGGFGQNDAYICFRDDGDWTPPINLGERVNSHGNEMRFSVTLDGKALFLGSTRDPARPKGPEFVAEPAVMYGDNDVYWIDASIISETRAAVLPRVWASEIVRNELQANGVASAIAMIDALRSDGEEAYHFSLFELLDLCERLIETGRGDEAEAFYSALMETFDPFRIQHGYAHILAYQGQVERALSLLDALADAGEALDLPGTLDFLFYALRERERIEDAMRVLEAKIERFPDSYHAYCHLARLYREKGDTEMARNALLKAIDINPDFGEARRILEELPRTRR